MSLINQAAYKISSSLGKFCCKRKRSYLVSRIVNQVKIFVRAAGNLNFDISSNGEVRVLECISTINPNIVFDVGASIGEWAILARQILPLSCVHAFEIVPDTYLKLVEASSGDKMIVANNIGLSDQSGSIKIYTSSHGSSVSTANKIHGMQFHANFYDGELDLEVMTGKSYIEDNSIENIDFLKIDIEGMELKVLLGLGDRIRDVKVIQFEYGIFNISSRALLIDFFNLLRPHGFLIGKIYPEFVEFFDYNFIDEDFGGHNYIAIKESEADLISCLAGR